MKTGALIVIPGESGPKGHERAMRKVGALSVVKRMCMTFHLAGVSAIAVVACKSGQMELTRHLAHMQAALLACLEEDASVPDAVRAGLAHLTGAGCERVLIAPVDVPMFSVGTVRGLLAQRADCAVPVCGGRWGYPVIARADQLEAALRGADGEEGLHGTLERAGAAPVDVDDAGVIVRLEQADECERIAAEHDLKRWRPVVKLRIAREEIFFGPGGWQLLSLIHSTGSVRLASEYMGISYSKAWKLLNTMEEQAGYRVLLRQQGGRGGGVSRLTEQGVLLMEWYEALEARCAEAVLDIFHSFPPPEG